MEHTEEIIEIWDYLNQQKITDLKTNFTFWWILLGSSIAIGISFGLLIELIF